MLPLEGIRVAEFSHMAMGPACGLILADRGAEVVKVEPPGKGDRARRRTSRGTGFFAAFSRNKRALQLDMDTPEGVGAARRLIAQGDVMIENFRPGAFAEKGLGAADVLARNRRLVHRSLKGFLPGPYENRAALDEVVQMMSGLATMTGPPGRPLRAGAAVNDMAGGAFAAIAILAALRRRDATGKGMSVQAGLFETSAWFVSTHVARRAITGKEPPSMAAGRRAWGVYDISSSGDDVPVFVGVVGERQWEILRSAVGEPKLGDARFATNSDRARHREALIPLVSALVARQPAAHWERVCVAAGLPFARVVSPGDLLDDPHLNHAGGLVPTRLPGGREAASPALPILLGGERLGTRLPPPGPGEHTADILRAPFGTARIVRVGPGEHTADILRAPADYRARATDRRGEHTADILRALGCGEDETAKAQAPA